MKENTVKHTNGKEEEEKEEEKGQEKSQGNLLLFFVIKIYVSNN